MWPRYSARAMTDLLVPLYRLDDAPRAPVDARFVVRKPIGPEHALCVRWTQQHFGAAWASEARVALGNRPVTAFIAMQADALIGIACYDATARGLFGPIGVLPGRQLQGIGAALLHAALRDMRASGYAYAVIGAPGPAAFFRRQVPVFEVPDSSPGLYAGMLREPAP